MAIKKLNPIIAPFRNNIKVGDVVRHVRTGDVMWLVTDKGIVHGFNHVCVVIQGEHPDYKTIKPGNRFTLSDINLTVDEFMTAVYAQRKPRS